MGIVNKIIRKIGVNLPAKYEWLGSAILGVLAFMAGTLLTWLLIAFSKEAHADQNGWFPSAHSFLYVERDERGTFCWGGPAGLTSNLGMDVTLWKKDILEFHARFTHHSCVLARDRPDYNAAGLGIVFRFDR